MVVVKNSWFVVGGGDGGGFFFGGGGEGGLGGCFLFFVVVFCLFVCFLVGFFLFFVGFFGCFLSGFFFFWGGGCWVVEVSFNPKSHFSKGSEYLTAVLLEGLVSPTSTFSVACCRARGTPCQMATGLLGT